MALIDPSELEKCFKILGKKDMLPNSVQLRLIALEHRLKEIISEIIHLGNILCCKKALGYVVDDNVLVVLKGSLAEGDPDPIVQNRLLEEGVLSPKGKGFIFTRDYAFTKPSPAATTVLGWSARGYTKWKNLKGKTLKKLLGRD